jgi:hypothetical protein
MLKTCKDYGEITCGTDLCTCLPRCVLCGVQQGRYRCTSTGSTHTTTDTWTGRADNQPIE